ncbi:MAG: cbb3-type cytochrome c oxidase subunit II [Candidatus Zixiibacteriota bacterium]
MFENVRGAFLIGGLLFFALSVAVMGWLPSLMVAQVKVETVEEISQTVIPEFEELAERYPEQFQMHFGVPGPESFAEALRLGRDTYIAEACWHCHSQFVRPVSNEAQRYGPVSLAAEYQNELNYPPLFGTRRVGPDLSREAGVRSNDWHAAHFFDPPSVVPTSVMPAFPWFFDENKKPNKKGLAVITYVQWLGSWIDPTGQIRRPVEAAGGQ